MSHAIDSKVVEMKFDHSQFKANVTDTISMLNKLKQSLKLPGATNSLSEIDRAAKKCDISALGQAAEAVQMKFSALQVFAITALTNISNAAINAGTNMVKSLTIAPITQGFQEYETQMNSVQTILANTSHQGTTLKDVTAALDELNTYADQTIYNFTEMTRNIGTFTAAGVDLDTSTSAIKGIANLAAVSGSSSQQASTAMYQLSQALAAGRVSLMDWNSVVNAGMGGKVFQNALIKTSEMMGTGAEEAIKKYGSFRESLTQGEWLTTDVLTQTLKQFTMAAEEGSEEWKAYKKELMDMGYTEKQAKEILTMANTATDAATKVKTFTQLIDTLQEAVGSGWAKTWQIIFGDFEEAKELWTGVSDTLGAFINKTSDARNEMLQAWKDLGGRKDLIEGFKNIFEGLVSIAKPIAQAFRDIFPPLTGKKLKSFTEGFKELTSHFKLGEKASKNLKDTFKGIFSVLDTVKMIFGGVIEAIKPLFGGMDNVVGGFLAVTGAVGRFITKIRDALDKSSAFIEIGKLIAGVLSDAKSEVKGIADDIVTIINDLNARFDGFVKALKRTWDSIETGDTDNPIVQFLNTTWKALATIGGAIITSVKQLFSRIKDSLDVSTIENLLTETLEIAVLGALGLSAKKIGDAAGNGFGLFEPLIEAFKSAKGAFTGAADLLDSVGESLSTWQQSLRADMLMEIAKALMLLAASLYLISLIDADELTTALSAIAGLFGELMLAMLAFVKIDVLGVRTALGIGLMTRIAGAIIVLAFALTMIAKLNFKQMMTGLIGVTGLCALIVGIAVALNKVKGKISSAAIPLLVISFAIKTLAGVCMDLASIGWKDLAKGLLGVGALIAGITIFLNTAKFDGKIMSACVGVLVMSVAIKVLASACAEFASMRVEDIIKGLVAMAGILAIVGTFVNKTANVGQLISFGVGLAIVAVSIHIFADAIKTLGAINIEDIIKGLGAMAATLVILSGAMRIMPKGSMIATGAGLIVVGIAMGIMADALTKLSNISIDGLETALGALGGSMVILAVGLHAMKGALGGAAALLVASAAIAVLAGSISVLAKLPLKAIVVALGAVAAVFVMLGIAAAVLTPLIPSIVALAGSIALIGLGIAAFGVGIMSVGLGLSLIAAGIAGIGASIYVFVKVLGKAVKAIIALVPEIGESVAKAVKSLAKTITDVLPVLVDLIAAIVKAMVDVFILSVPVLVDGLMVLLDTLLTKIAEYTPKIAQACYDIVLSILEVTAANIGKVAKAGADIVINFMNGMAQEMGRIVTAAIDLIVAFVNGIGANIGKVVQSGFDLIISFINGLTNAINENTPALVEAMKGLILALLNAALLVLTGGVDLFGEAGKMIMDSGLIQGVAKMAGSLISAIGGLLKKGLSAVVSKAGGFLSAGKNLIVNVINGIGNKAAALKNKVGNMISNGLKSVTKTAGSWLKAGGNLIQRLINGIGSKLGSLTGKAGELINAAKNRISSISLVQVGRDMIQGLINGIGEKAHALVEKAKGVVNDAIQAAKNLLKINSPSKVFMSFGRSIDEGLIVGMDQMAGQVVKTTEGVGKGAIKSMAGVMSRIGDSINTDIDVNPTITPVIDLTEVQNGITRMNSMINGRTVSMSASIDSAVDRTSSLSGSSDASSSIVDAINRLRTDISNMKTTENNLNFNGTVFNDDDRINSLMVSLLTELARKGAMGIG